MLKKDIKSFIKNTLLVLIFTALFFVLPPPLSFVCEVLAVSYFAYSIVKHDYRLLILEGALCLSVCASLGGVYGLIISGLSIILLALSLGIGAKMKIPYPKVLFICSAVYLFSSAGSIYLVKNVSGDVFSLEYFYNTFNSVFSAMNESGYVLNQTAIDAVNSYVKSVVLFMMQITPAMMIIASIFCAFILTHIFKTILIKSKSSVYLNVTPFDRMHIGRLHALAFIVLLMFNSLSAEGVLSDSILNVVIVLGFIFFASGISLLDFRLKAQGKKKSTRRLMEIAIIPVSYMFMFIPVFTFVLMGVADSFFNFRKHTIKKQG